MSKHPVQRQALLHQARRDIELLEREDLPSKDFLLELISEARQTAGGTDTLDPER